jgi:hypothetical protein
MLAVAVHPAGEMAVERSTQRGEDMKRLVAIGVLSVVGLVLMAGSATASAATEFGDPCTANGFAAGVPVSIFTLNSSSPLPAAAPISGVITKWSANAGAALPEGQAGLPETFKVFRANPVNETVLAVGGDTETLVPGANTFAVRIPVQAGDLLGISPAGESDLLYCKETALKTSFGAFEGAASTGTTVPYVQIQEPLRIPLVATVEPDVDGDGYGDETQDQCPTDASTHGPCPVRQAAPAPPAPPAPAAPIALSASAAAKKSFLTVSLTTTAQASVTVTGTATIGKGKTVKLSGNTQTVALGALAKFTVLFPAKLKAALKQLPTSKKLTINLSATAPGATTKTLTVKVPGQMKLEKKHHVR